MEHKSPRPKRMLTEAEDGMPRRRYNITSTKRGTEVMNP